MPRPRCPAGTASRGLFVNWEELCLVEEKCEGRADTAGSSRSETDALRQLHVDVEFRVFLLQVGVNHSAYV